MKKINLADAFLFAGYFIGISIAVFLVYYVIISVRGKKKGEYDDTYPAPVYLLMVIVAILMMTQYFMER